MHSFDIDVSQNSQYLPISAFSAEEEDEITRYTAACPGGGPLLPASLHCALCTLKRLQEKARERTLCEQVYSYYTGHFSTYHTSLGMRLASKFKYAKLTWTGNCREEL